MRTAHTEHTRIYTHRHTFMYTNTFLLDSRPGTQKPCRLCQDSFPAPHTARIHSFTLFSLNQTSPSWGRSLGESLDERSSRRALERGGGAMLQKRGTFGTIGSGSTRRLQEHLPALCPRPCPHQGPEMGTAGQQLGRAGPQRERPSPCPVVHEASRAI